LAYRNMFGSAIFASLPPIIKASLGPNKILPNNADAQADNSAHSGTAAQANSDKLVSREEQPVNIEPPKVSSRVVATIPIGAGQTPLPPVATAPAPAVPDTSAPYSTASTSTASVPQPDGSQPAPSLMPTTAAGPPAGPAAAPSEPKKVRTVLIHADQSSATAAQPAAPALAPAPRSARSAAAKASASAAAAPVGANAPLSIVPGAEGEAVPPAAAAPAPVAPVPSRSRAAAAAPPPPVTMASAEPSAAVPASAPSSGGYAVQVTSQHSEADAQASFKELRAKFPNQLSGREPIIRRADLGSKGVFYRAMVGPFASMEEAAGVCSSLKAAGGNCLVQRN
jgi:SPOR domain